MLSRAEKSPARIFFSPASSRTGTPSFRAESSLDPASAPATTKLVALLTVPATLAPMATRADLGLGARHRLQSAREDEGYPFQGPFPEGAFFPPEGQACGLEALHHGPVLGDVEEGHDFRGHLGSNALHLLEGLLRGGHEGVEGEEPAREGPRRLLAHLADSQGVEDPLVGSALARLDLFQEVGGRFFPHARQRGQGSPGRGRRGPGGRHHAPFHERVHEDPARGRRCPWRPARRSVADPP